MKNDLAIRLLFWVAAAYDGLLGALFLAFPLALYEWCGVTPPNHVGYVQFPALLLIVFALMFASVARHPVRNRGLIWYGVLLKLSFCAVAFGHWFAGGIPSMWKPFAVADACFALLFVWAIIMLRGRRVGTI